MRASLDRFVVTFGAVLAVIVFCAALFGVARGEQPECTGDRHYDGVACCPYTGDTTTTTLAPRVECPDPAPCPTVECTCGEGTVVNNITVNRCPAVTFPKYAPCRARKAGDCRDGDVVFNGECFKCPRRLTPHRAFIPLS